MGNHTAANDSDQHVLDRLVGELAHDRVDAAGVRRVLSEFQADDSSTIHLAYRLVTTGHYTARVAAIKHLQQEVEIVHSILKRGGVTDDWKQQNAPATSPHIKHSLLAFWNLAELASVTNRPAKAAAIRHLNGTVLQMHMVVNPTLPPYDTDYSADESYWRGLAALTLTELPLEEDTSKRSGDYAAFVQLAARCSDTPRLVALVAERGTLNAPSLEAVLCEEQNVSPSLRNGIL